MRIALLVFLFTSNTAYSQYATGLFRNYSPSIALIDKAANLSSFTNNHLGLMASNLFGIDSYSELKVGVVLVNDASRLALAFNLNQAHLHPSRSSLAACSKLKSGFYLGTAYSIYYPSSLSSKFAFNYQIGIAQKIGNQWRYSAHFSRYHHNSNEYANSSQFTFLINYDWSEQLRLSWDLLLGEEAIAAFGILIEQDSKEYQLIILSTKALQISYAKEYNDFKILFALQSHLALGLSPLFNLDYEI